MSRELVVAKEEEGWKSGEFGVAMEENPKCGRRSLRLAVPFASNNLLRSVNLNFQQPYTRFKEATHLY